MNSVEFTAAVMSLGCSEKTASTLIRLASSLSQKSSSVSLDDLFVECLGMIPRALSSYRLDGTAAVTTHVVTVARNACLTLLSREKTHEEREQALGYEQSDVPRGNGSQSQVVYRDELDLLEQILSPYAWRLLMLIQQSAPAPLSGRVAGERLHLSATSVNHLRDEIRVAVTVILGEPKRKSRVI